MQIHSTYRIQHEQANYFKTFRFIKLSLSSRRTMDCDPAPEFHACPDATPRCDRAMQCFPADPFKTDPGYHPSVPSNRRRRRKQIKKEDCLRNECLYTVCLPLISFGGRSLFTEEVYVCVYGEKGCGGNVPLRV
jgi:hypothetical protein